MNAREEQLGVPTDAGGIAALGAPWPSRAMPASPELKRSRAPRARDIADAYRLLAY